MAPHFSIWRRFTATPLKPLADVRKLVFGLLLISSPFFF
jgi:hypothetical protein